MRPYVLLSCAMSVDGRIDHRGPSRLILSNDADLDRVDAERAASDAILVGAGTLQRDDPRLLVRSAARRADRVRRGLPESPAKVAIAGGELDPALRFFVEGAAEKLVYAPAASAAALRERLGTTATVVGAGDPLDLRRVLADLDGRGVRRLMVEGGATVNTAFLTAGLVDELQLVVAPLFVGDGGAPPFVRDGVFPDRMTLAEARPIGDVVLLRYLLTETARDRRWLQAAIELSRGCPPSDGAYSVGAVIVAADGEVIARGYSRETDPTVHAEEAALATVTAAARRDALQLDGAVQPAPVAAAELRPADPGCGHRTGRVRAAGAGPVRGLPGRGGAGRGGRGGGRAPRPRGAGAGGQRPPAQMTEIPQLPETCSPGSRTSRPRPLRNASGAHVIGSTAMLRRRSPSDRPSPVNSIR
jgi:riboflavin-specific deaminase-like protein